MIVAEVADLLQAWAAWSRQGRIGPAPPTCRSLERNYVPEAGELFDALDERIEPAAPRVPDALVLKVERAVLAVNPLHRDALIGHYIRRLPAQLLEQRLRTRNLGRILGDAERAVARRLPV